MFKQAYLEVSHLLSDTSPYVWAPLQQKSWEWEWTSKQKSSDLRHCHITLFHIQGNSCGPSQGSIYLTYYYSQLSHFVIEEFTIILSTKLQFVWSFWTTICVEKDFHTFQVCTVEGQQMHKMPWSKAFSNYPSHWQKVVTAHILSARQQCHITFSLCWMQES